MTPAVGRHDAFAQRVVRAADAEYKGFAIATFHGARDAYAVRVLVRASGEPGRVRVALDGYRAVEWSVPLERVDVLCPACEEQFIRPEWRQGENCGELVAEPCERCQARKARTVAL